MNLLGGCTYKIYNMTGANTKFATWQHTAHKHKTKLLPKFKQNIYKIWFNQTITTIYRIFLGISTLTIKCYVCLIRLHSNTKCSLIKFAMLYCAEIYSIDFLAGEHVIFNLWLSGNACIEGSWGWKADWGGPSPHSFGIFPISHFKVLILLLSPPSYTNQLHPFLIACFSIKMC